MKIYSNPNLPKQGADRNMRERLAAIAGRNTDELVSLRDTQGKQANDPPDRQLQRAHAHTVSGTIPCAKFPGHRHKVCGTTGPAITSTNGHIHEFHTDTTPCACGRHIHPIKLKTGPAIFIGRDKTQHYHCLEGQTGQPKRTERCRPPR